MQNFCLILLAILCWCRPSLAMAQARSHLPIAKGSWYKVYTTPCQLELTPNYQDQFKNTPAHLCFHGKVQFQGIGFLGAEAAPPLYLGDHALGASLHYRRYHALHARALWRTVHQPQLSKRATVESLANTAAANLPERSVDYALYQYGKTNLDRWQLSLGRLTLPFGLNTSLFEGYGFWWTREAFWRSPPFGGMLTYDNLRNFTVETGWAREAQGHASPAAAASTRLMVDISAWHGTRLILSAYGHSNGQRRMGAAFRNESPRGTLTQFEWVRLLPKLGASGLTFEQLFRLGIEGGLSGKQRSYFQYEDTRYTSRLAALGHSYYWRPQQRVSLAVIYRNDLATRVIAWGLGLGVGAYL